MARISDFTPVTSQRQSMHELVECGWRYFDVQGRRLLQLDTYGSSDRKIRGKISQSVQLDEEAAKQLLNIIAEAFPRLFEANRPGAP